MEVTHLAGRNTARGDSFFNLDFEAAKRFNLTEGQYLLFHTEVFNALNRANFGLPSASSARPASAPRSRRTAPRA